jgi:hypothetical protein
MWRANAGATGELFMRLLEHAGTLQFLQMSSYDRLSRVTNDHVGFQEFLVSMQLSCLYNCPNDGMMNIQ